MPEKVIGIIPAAGFAVYALRTEEPDSYFYVGCTNNIKRRVADHFNSTMRGNHPNPELARHLVELGRDNLVVEIMDTCDKQYKGVCESNWYRLLRVNGFALLNKIDPLFTALGFGGYNHTEATKQKLSKWRKGKSPAPMSPEGLERLRQSKLGVPRSEETKRKLSEYWTGRKTRPPSRETREKQRAGNVGQKRTDETRANISAALKASWEKKRKVKENA